MIQMPQLRIIAGGMCCSVGYSAPAASAAIRAEIDHFHETDFVGAGGKPVIGAQLYQNPLWGPERYTWMFERVTQECLQRLPGIPPQAMTLILLLPEQNRPGINALWAKQTVNGISHSFHRTSRVFPHGKSALGSALTYARALFANKQSEYALIVGVDSYFQPETLNYYLNDDRLLSGDNHGFIPGEGAGAVVVTAARPGERGVRITGVGIAQEEAHWLQDEKVHRAEGMTAAIRMAQAQSGKALSGYQFHIGDISGEAYYFKEISLALTRCFDEPVADFPHLTPASSLGETGAAVGPLILAYLSELMMGKDAPGSSGLVHFSADSGYRVVLTVET